MAKLVECKDCKTSQTVEEGKNVTQICCCGKCMTYVEEN